MIWAHATLALCLGAGLPDDLSAPGAGAVGGPPAAKSMASLAHGFVGAQRCGECHGFALRVWAASPHATAHRSLNAAQLADTRCNTCHSAGPVTGGQFVGVQCESCHGPGKLYQPDYVMRDRELSRAVGLVDQQPAQCQQCHTQSAPSVSPFDYAALWALIDHSKAAEARWAAVRSQAVAPIGAAGAPDSAN
jgi:hypothetical protein